MFIEDRIPIVMIGRDAQVPTASSVTVDNEGGGRAALEYIYSLGHRQVAFIKGPQQIEDSRRRWRGITRFAQSVGLDVPAELVVELKDKSPTYQSGYDLTAELLAVKKPFTALVAFDDMTAFGAIRALRMAGRDVQKDCSVIGFDDAPAAAYYSPPLTTISQHMEQLGRTGVEIALRAIAAATKKKPFEAVHTSIESTLVPRESTRAIEVSRPELVGKS